MSEPLGVTMGFMPFPRGGSAFVALELAKRLQHSVDDFALVAGSWADGPNPGMADAGTFFAKVSRLVTVDYHPGRTAAPDAGTRYAAGMHPSFEHKQDAPDRVLSSFSPSTVENFVTVWAKAFAETTDGKPTIFHLHHLGPMNTAVRRCADAHVVAHLHGTELKFVVQAREAARGEGPWPGHPMWRHAGYWADELHRAAHEAARILCVSEEDAALATELFRLRAGAVTVIENGVDTDQFAPLRLTDEEKLRLWTTWLVEDPRGWDSTNVPGTIAYSPERLRASFLTESGRPRPVLLCVARFLRWKRLTDVIDAYVAARDGYGVRSPLVIWGGYPGECEGTHPYEYARSTGDEGIFFTGWRGLEDLRYGYAAADLLVNGADSEPFGTAILQAMATGTPVLSTRTGGPVKFIQDGGARQNGWFFELGDCRELARRFAELTGSVHEWRDPLAAQARRAVLDGYSWDRVMTDVHNVYESVRLRTFG